MNSFTVIAACLSLFLCAHTSQAELDLLFLPENFATYQGSTIELECSVTVGTVGQRVQWVEYAYSDRGGLISDNEYISPEHPQFARYELIHGNAQQYKLRIRNVTMADSGTYLCTDNTAPTVVKFRHSAELIVFAGEQSCVTTIPTPPIAALDGVYYSSECTMSYGTSFIRPSMIWLGPAPFGQGQSITDVSAWNGKSFYAQSSFHNLYWTSRTYFSDAFLPVPDDVADNVPDFVDIYDTVRIVVNWPPRNLYAHPIKPLNEYEVGDSMECIADGFPAPSFLWRNLRTGETLQNSIFVIPFTWLGTNQVMMCEAFNTINGEESRPNLLITVNVPVPTTPTPPPSIPPTTTPAPEAQCDDLKGLWESTEPSLARACLEVDLQGNVHGVLRVGYDTYWYDMVGQTNYPFNDHTSWTAIWPLNRAVTTFIGECSKCHGEETLVVNAVSRSKGQGTCGIPGVITYTEQYHFKRRQGFECPPITFPF